MTDTLKYYQVLNTTPQASEDQIKKNYRDLAKVWHPDYNKDPQAIERFQHISIAYDTLSDPQARQFYDVFSIAYKKQPAPDMRLLKIYKNKKDKDDPSLRALTIYKKNKKTTIIASKSEAKQIVISSLFNIKNYTINLFNKEENLQTLLHNALAYNLENNNQMASLYASQALEFANKEEKQTITIWQKTLNTPIQTPPTWNYGSFSKYKFLPILPVFIILIILGGNNYITSEDLLKYFEKNKKITYYQEVQFMDGRQTVDDLDLKRIINYAVDIYDKDMLFHLSQDAEIKYGPSQNFDTLQKGTQGQTIRLTGITPDKIWARIMIDDGQMGFVEKEILSKGIKNPIPKDSRISK